MAVKNPVDRAQLSVPATSRPADVSGEFVDLAGERYYAIRNVDKMAPFFVSVISNDDHWLFVSSTGGLTAGRVSPETALFPYITVDKIHDSTTHTGPVTLFKVDAGGDKHNWDPFAVLRIGADRISRNIYKNLLGNKLCFEEINHDLELVFRYTWLTSDRFGFVRDCELGIDARFDSTARRPAQPAAGRHAAVHAGTVQQPRRCLQVDRVRCHVAPRDLLALFRHYGPRRAL